jgi:hypothetical protein
MADDDGSFNRHLLHAFPPPTTRQQRYHHHAFSKLLAQFIYSVLVAFLSPSSKSCVQ